MSRTIAYDPTKRSLFKPCADAIMLDGSATRSEALLCAELARLVYCPFERDAATRQAVTSQLSGIGFSDTTFFDANGLQALLTVDPVKHVGVLTYRGTEPDEAKKDVLTNINVPLRTWDGAGCVHSGFAKSLAGKWEDIRAALDAHADSRMLYTGHSLGAALATLSAALRPPAALYTFGSPKVGDAAFAASMAGVVHDRYVDCLDVVCRLLDVLPLYQHVGVQKYFDRNGELRAAISEADIRTDQRSAWISYLFNYSWRPGNVPLRDGADHAPINYIYALRALP